jgi:hypothetical protein
MTGEEMVMMMGEEIPDGVVGEEAIGFVEGSILEVL